MEVREEQHEAHTRRASHTEDLPTAVHKAEHRAPAALSQFCVISTESQKKML